VVYLLNIDIKQIGGQKMGNEINSWAEELGNHRARILVSEKADAVWVHIPWRRRDTKPENKDIVIINGVTGEKIKNFVMVNINREFGDIIFQATNAPCEYFLYYMPIEISDWRAFPKVTYLFPKSEADQSWISSNSLTSDQLSKEKLKSLPKAEFIEIQSRSEFDRFGPMEMIATTEEKQEMLTKYKDRAYLLFPENREYPVWMTDDLPYRWIQNEPGFKFGGEAKRGEFYAFQIGIYSSKQNIDDIAIEFNDLVNNKNNIIPAHAFNCFNLGGTDYWGRNFQKAFSITKDKVGSLWFGIQIPQDAEEGEYSSILAIKSENADPGYVSISLKVLPEILEDCGDSQLWRMSRLRWLNSTIGIDDGVVPPYIPLKVSEKSITCLNRTVEIDAKGMLASIISNGREILASPISFNISQNVDTEIKTHSKVVYKSSGNVIWEGDYTHDDISVHTWAKMEFDGYINYRISVKTEREISVDDIYLEIPICNDIAKYMMGMGRKGGYRPKEWQWKWNKEIHQDSVWIGDADAGIQFKLKGPDYEWPLVNVHYRIKPLNIPDAWHNGGKGGCEIIERDGIFVLRAYSGKRILNAGQELRFDFGLLITPVKPLDKKHWDTRYYHAYHPIDEVANSEANNIIIHHGNDINPYINYPFIAVDKLKKYVDQAHEKNLKVKIYYTLRELSNHIVEMPVVRSLGYEVFVNGPGGGYSWLQEHLGNDYAPAWHHWFPDGDVDAALVTSGLSRWHNYYLEGLSWLFRNVKIDGLYLDDVGYDREIMKRMRKIFHEESPSSLIDMHSWNHFNDIAGWANSANLYMEHMPYIDSLWIGEGFDYNETPDYWLVEISGIPFGLFSEMLEHGGNPWRGMVYGMTTRLPYSGDPRPLWRLWDEFGIQDAEIAGYWSSSCPVRTDHEKILATAYVKSDKVLIAIASWAEEAISCHLSIDYGKLGFGSDKSKLYAPAIDKFQGESVFQTTDAIPIEPGHGWLLILE
jgi:hypothetical protein